MKKLIQWLKNMWFVILGVEYTEGEDLILDYHEHPKDFTQGCDQCDDERLEWRDGKLISGRIVNTNVNAMCGDWRIFLCNACARAHGYKEE